ncbi:hypothetical protein AAF712_012376 [Marasmius tenuissimus]|uniref:F-box domain-containing protein n=1 Tax=Marasmius tenuissimus TaxID=585030 RepID=A0ABR2ZK49_9AGAR
MQRVHHPIPNSFFREHMAYERSQHHAERECLEDDIGTLKAYDLQLSALESIRERLSFQRNEVATRIQRRQHLLSSFRKVPAEIWSQIFVEICTISSRPYESEDIDTSLVWFGRPRSFYPIQISEHCVEVIPQTLSQVCYRWRNIVKTYPELWCRISIDLSLYLLPNQERFQDYASATFRHALKNSRGRPLMLRLDSFRLQEEQHNYTLAPSLLEEFREAFHRTRNLDASIDLFSQVDFQGIVSFPILNHATLRSDRPLVPHEEPYSDHQVQEFLSSPSLATLCVSTIRWLIAVVPWSFQSLTTFTCYDMFTKSDLRRLHCTCPQLQELTIKVNWTAEMIMGDSNLLIFPRLTTLVLNYDGWNPLPVLHHILAPSLVSLAHNTVVSRLDMVASLWDFIDHSGCRLEHLCFMMDTECLTSTPSLWHSLSDRLDRLRSFELTVRTEDVDQSSVASEELLTLMRRGSSTASRLRLPALTSFSFTILQGGFVQLDGPVLQSILHAFIEVAESRRYQTGTMMEAMTWASISIKFRSWGGFPNWFDPPITLCVDSGVDIAQLRQRAVNLARYSSVDVLMEVGGTRIYPDNDERAV